MNEASDKIPEAVPAGSPSPSVDSKDVAWISIPTPFDVSALAGFCRDIEALYRVNPYLYFKEWRQTGPSTYHAEFQNQSNNQGVVLDLEISSGPDLGFTVKYAQGVKKRTVFAIEPVGPGSRLVITDDYEGLSEAERRQREQEIDKSLPAWGEGLLAYFKRLKRWSWLPGWCWYIRRIWIPLKPSARRILWLLYLITLAEFGFFLFIMLIYVIEQHS